MIIVTGGAGFIGSAFVWKLNRSGITNVIIVDNLNTSEKWSNLLNLRFEDYIHKDKFIKIIAESKFADKIESLIHMGACSSTTESNLDYLMENNYLYTKTLAEWCLRKKTKFLYASSAATYGDGTNGFSDDDKDTVRLKPINRYGYSKHLFDLWAINHGVMRKITGF
ncbi:MAG: NAD-dependent epimerase/dehydratase family protein, partial [Elusimicrobiota bacterium]